MRQTPGRTSNEPYMELSKEDYHGCEPKMKELRHTKPGRTRTAK